MRNARFYDYIAIILVLLAGSYAVFFATNTFFYDVIGFSQGGFNIWYLINALPHLCLMVEIVGFVLFWARYLKIKHIFRAHHVKVYSIVAVILSGIGLISTIMSGIFYWNGNFLAASPYPASMLVCLIVHSAIFALAATSVVINFIVRNSEDERFIYAYPYAFYTLGVALLIFYILYRVGAFTYSIIWIWPSSHAFDFEYNQILMAIPFFLSLVLPIFIGASIFGDKLVIFKKDFFKEHIPAWIIYLVLGIAFGVYTVLMIKYVPSFDNVIKVACPLMVLHEFPIDAIVLVAFNILVPLGYLIYLIVINIKIKKRQQ